MLLVILLVLLTVALIVVLFITIRKVNKHQGERIANVARKATVTADAIRERDAAIAAQPSVSADPALAATYNEAARIQAMAREENRLPLKSELLAQRRAGSGSGLAAKAQAIESREAGLRGHADETRPTATQRALNEDSGAVASRYDALASKIDSSTIYGREKLIAAITNNEDRLPLKSELPVMRVEELPDLGSADRILEHAATVQGRLPLKSEMKPKRTEISRSEYKRREREAAALRIAAKKEGKELLEFVVEGQNPNIGMRNVHVIEAGHKMSLGGGNSDFLVFLMDTPSRVADVHFDGEKLIVVPLKAEFVPGMVGPTNVALGESFEILSKRSRPLRVKFVAYERETDKINKLLHCIELPGVVNGK
jgi:hypothetical protein